MGGCYEKVLIDAAQGINEGELELDSSEFGFTGKQAPTFTINSFPLAGGKQDGVDVIHVDNGCFDFTVCPTRGMGILEGQCHGVRLGWDSPVEEVVNPACINLEGRGGLGWLEGFNEYMVRCGLTNNGAPFTDDEGTRWPLHGRIANTPASFVAVSVDLEAPYTIRVIGAVRQVCAFKEDLVLETEIATEPGADWIRISDRVTNLGGTPVPIQMLYHNNYGTPLMSENARLVIPAEMAVPRDAGYGNDSTKRWNKQLAPTTGEGEECWFVKPKADRKGMTKQMIVSGGGDIGVSQTYALKSLPCFTLWKHPSDLTDGYVTGLEPATNFPNPMEYEKKQKRMVMLRSNKNWEMSMTIGVKVGKKAVTAEEKTIQAIQGRKAIEVFSAPQPRFSPEGDR